MMNSIKIVIPSLPGTTDGIGTILKFISDYPENVLQVLHLYRNRPEGDSTFIAFFQEPNSIFQITAIINPWGTSFGYNGEAPRGYGAIRSVIEERELRFEQHEWQSFLAAKNGQGRPFKKWNDENLTSTIEYIKQWEELLTERCYFSLCSLLPHESYSFDLFNDYWKNKWETTTRQR